MMSSIVFPKVDNWIAELTTTQGTGAIQLDGAIDGFNTFSVVGDGLVYYVIENGENKETGVGTLSGRQLQRTTVQATLVNNSYSKSSNPISLVGVSTVYCAANAYQYELMVAAIKLVEQVSADVDTKVPLSGSVDMENDFKTTGGFIGSFIRAFTDLKFGLHLNPDSVSPSIQPVNPDGTVNALHALTFFPSLNKWFVNGGEIYSSGNKPKFQDLSDSVFWLQPAGGKIRVGGNTDLTAGRGDKGFLAYQAGVGDAAVSYVGKQDWWFQEAWVNQYFGKTINITGTINGVGIFDDGERVYSPINKPMLSELGAESSSNSQIWKNHGIVSSLDSGNALLPGYFQFGPSLSDGPVLNTYGHGFTSSIGASSENNFITQTVYTHDQAYTMWFRILLNGSAQPWVRVYTDARKPTATEIGAVQGSHKAGFLPAGPTSERPEAVDFPANTRALRFNTLTDQWEGLNPNGDVIPIGGGGVPPFITKTTSFTVEKRKAYKLIMSDGISKIVTVDDGMANDDWFVVSTVDWDRSLFGVTATIQFNTERLNNGSQDFDGYIIDRPCVLYFLKSGGKWTLADGIGIDGSYNALENRVENLESWPKTGSNANGTWVMYEDGRMECEQTVDLGNQAYGVAIGALYKSTNNFTWIFPMDFIVPPKVFVMSNNASHEWLFPSCSTPAKQEVLYAFFSTSASSSVKTVAGLLAKGRWK